MPSHSAAVRRFVAGAAVDSLGTGLSSVAVILYFVTFIGFRADSVALMLSAAAFFGLLLPVPLGILADRVGLVRVYCAVLISRGTGFALYAIAHNYALFAIATVLAVSLETTTSSLQQSLVGRIVDGRSRVATMSLVRAARNATLGTGALIAGIALASRSPIAVAGLFVANGASFLILALTVVSIRSYADSPAPSISNVFKKAPGGGNDLPVAHNARFIALAILNALFSLHDSIFFVFLPLWAVTRLHLSPGVPPIFIAINTAFTVFIQLVFSRTKRMENFTGLVLLMAAVSLVLACAICIGAQSFQGLLAVSITLAAVVLLTVGENLHSIAAWQVSFEMAPPSRRTEYMAAFNMSSGLQRAVGPIFMTAVILRMGTIGWLTLIAVFVLSASAFWSIARVPMNEALTARPDAATSG